MLERSYTAGKRTLAYHIKNHIIGLTVFGEILLSVINDLVCANRAQHVQFPCAVHGRHLSPKVLGKLYRKRPDTSPGTINQDLSGLHGPWEQVLLPLGAEDHPVVHI